MPTICARSTRAMTLRAQHSSRHGSTAGGRSRTADPSSGSSGSGNGLTTDVVALHMSTDALTPFLESTQTVAIITTRPDGTEVATPIWSVAADGAGYVRSY